MGVITVKGRGYVSAQPDAVTLSFTTGSKARDYAECMDSLNGRTAALRRDLSASGADCAELKTADFRVDVEYREEKGHSGAEIRIRFSVKCIESLRRQALAEAVKVARLSAESLAQAAGAKLGKLQSIAHGWDEIRLSGPAYGVVCERASDYAVDTDPKDVSVSEDVTLVYEIVE